MKRFYDKVHIDPETGCWEWKAYRDKGGYGRLQINKKPMSAHRFSYELHGESWPMTTRRNFLKGSGAH